VRILLDQNLSPRLKGLPRDVFPTLESVYDHGLTGASDPKIFQWARKENIDALITTDLDLVKLAEQAGPPPKVIRIERCDFSSKIVAQLIKRDSDQIQ